MSNCSTLLSGVHPGSLVSPRRGKPFYGVAMLKESQRHGYRLSPGTLYPVLHGPGKAGYLSIQRAVQTGRLASITGSPTRGGMSWKNSSAVGLEGTHSPG